MHISQTNERMVSTPDHMPLTNKHHLLGFWMQHMYAKMARRGKHDKKLMAKETKMHRPKKQWNFQWIRNQMWFQFACRQIGTLQGIATRGTNWCICMERTNGRGVKITKYSFKTRINERMNELFLNLNPTTVGRRASIDATKKHLWSFWLPWTNGTWSNGCNERAHCVLKCMIRCLLGDASEYAGVGLNLTHLFKDGTHREHHDGAI